MSGLLACVLSRWKNRVSAWPGVHDAENRRNGSALYISSGLAWLLPETDIFDAFEQVQKRLICLTAEAAKHAGFIQADGGEQVRVYSLPSRILS